MENSLLVEPDYNLVLDRFKNYSDLMIKRKVKIESVLGKKD